MTFFALGDARNRERDDDERAAALAAANVSGALEATVAWYRDNRWWWEPLKARATIAKSAS